MRLAVGIFVHDGSDYPPTRAARRSEGSTEQSFVLPVVLMGGFDTAFCPVRNSSALAFQ